MELEAKKGIENLINKYNAILAEGKVNSYNEAQTRNEFIEPLFEFLGWDMRNLKNEHEVLTEESTSKGRIDLAFRLNNIPVMFLEAKALKVDLDDWKWAEQAINYSWNKGVTWAVLTDFESIKVFNAEIPPKGLSDNLFFEISYKDYINKFDQLRLLSREGFKQGLLTQEAQKWGKITKRKQVGEKLFEDLTAWRSLLSKGFAKKNKLEQDELDEGVQRVLDRLIFIRAAEDREIEPNILLPLLRNRESDGHKGKLYHSLAKIFRQFDDGYNSKIFALHYSEEWGIDDDIVAEIVRGLYATKDGYRYDFSAISADILGGIYEQYLGHVLKQAQKSARVTEEHKKRKSQGIYYTPHYIVDFIVKETLGEVLKNTKPKDISKIKVLDPACGSGSFLTAAYDEILNYYQKHSAKQTLFTKFDILKDNIYGVDLDVQAVEIAQLNLLLKVLSQKTKLPTLQHNIRVGNSLISEGDERFKPFNWQEEFKEVFRQGGFDVIIGNPPYVAITGIGFNLRRTYEDLYKTAVGRFDLFMLFLEKSLTLLKKGGFLGFIIPNKFLTNNQSQKLRRYILENGNIESILLTQEKVFSSANVNNIVLIIQKGKRHGFCKINEYKNGKIVQISKTENNDFVLEPENRFLVSGREAIPPELLKKITNESVKLGEIAEIKDGIVAGRIKDLLFHKEKSNHYCEPLLFGGDVNRYQKKFSGNFVDYHENFMMNKEIERAKGKRIGLWMRNKSIFSRPKILTRKTADKIIAVFDDENYYYEQTLHSTYIKNSNYLPLYVLALFNSGLFRFYYQSIIKQSGTIFPQVRISLLKSLPIKKVSIEKQQKLASFVQQMLDCSRGLQAVHLHTDQNNNLKLEIEKLDHEIDEEIYRLYGLTREEIEIVESDRVG